MGLFWGALLAIAGPADAAIDFRWIAKPDMEQALRDCNLTEFTISYEADWQSDIVDIDDTEVSDEQLRCAFLASDRTQYILLWDTPLHSRFQEIRREYWVPRAKDQAKSYFAARPELGTIPQRAPEQSIKDFSKSLERFCGPSAEGFFTEEYGGLTSSPNWVAQKDYSEIAEVLGCLKNAAILSDLNFGFIGNMKMRSEPENAP